MDEPIVEDFSLLSMGNVSSMANLKFYDSSSHIGHCRLQNRKCKSEPNISNTWQPCEPVLSQCWLDAKQRFSAARLHDLEVSGNMERENMHMYLSEMLISAIERMNWHYEEQHSNFLQCPKPVYNQSCSASSNSLANGTRNDTELLTSEHRTGKSIFYAPVGDVAIDKTGLGKCECASRTNENRADDDDNSAEGIASALLRRFSAAACSIPDTDVQWLVSYAQAPQKLLPITREEVVTPEEYAANGKLVLLRGSNNWAPPRKQWIFILHPRPSSVAKMLETQDNRCAGCGIQITEVYSKRMRYCEYFGKLFCQRCHQGVKAQIPARIISQWNFRNYPVSDAAYQFLTENYDQPVINALAVDSRFYERVRILKRIRMLRIKLFHIWSYISICKTARDTVTKHGNLRTMFTSIPSHLLKDPDIYSLADLHGARSGELLQTIEPLVQYGRYHIEGCRCCRAQAFVCELCDKKDDLLFPFQLEKVDRCSDCGSLSHLKCAVERKRRREPCPKCARIAENWYRHTYSSIDSL
ncbi:hypothetical protein AB6A40_000345 [Gnathostoma spinigerum]|uniref:Rubicon Homology domain-containing protein n=1 Tax=Gnathostoma spinigerum TaxID=75299 RepID=A0ABD6E3Y1_9BILA